MDELLGSQPSPGEEALRICKTLVRSNALDVIVLDSVAALVTKAELEGEIGDSTVGAQARLNGICFLCPRHDFFSMDAGALRSSPQRRLAECSSMKRNNSGNPGSGIFA